jgi:hypothetical protein
MSALPPLPDLTFLPQPPCPKCHSQMKLCRITAARPAFDLRLFVCGKCNHVERVLVRTEPSESPALGWLLGELRPPS